MRWIQRFINPGTLYLPRPSGRGKYIILGLINPGIIQLKVINCFIIWHISYVAFTLKISFYHNVFFGFIWCKTLECYIHCTLHVTYCEVIIAFYQRRLLGRSANQKRHYLKSYNNVNYSKYADIFRRNEEGGGVFLDLYVFRSEMNQQISSFFR
jgi:hypothetical protein